MTTDTKPLAPTDAEIATLIDKEMREYSIGAYADHGSARNQLEHFAREVLAKRGAQPVPAWYALVPVEPSAEMVDAAQEAYMPFGDMQLAIQLAIAAAPQPVAREPLTLDEFSKAFPEYTGCIVGTNQGLLMAAKSATERAHGSRKEANMALTPEKIDEIAGPADYFDRRVFARAIESEVRARDEALIRQLVDALCMPCDRWNGTQSRIVREAIDAANAWLEAKK